MLGIKDILKDPEKFQRGLRRKDPDIDVHPLINTYEKMCQIKTELEEVRSEMNSRSKEIGELKRAGKDTTSLMDLVSSLKIRSHTLSEECTELEVKYETLLSVLPNLPDEDIKFSLDPKDNVCVKTHGNKPSFSFAPKNHMELGEIHDLFDFPRGAKISGSGWPIYKGMGARLEWALINLMIETHIENGFVFHMIPHLVRPDAMYGSGQLPKFKDQLFRIHDKDHDLFLIPTAEVALNGLHIDEFIPLEDLPKLYVAYSPCFRREAGSAGKAERGLIRVHQFNKVEMFAFTTSENSDAVFDMMTKSAESILQKLELHYRNMLLVTGDMSYAAAKTLDVEVWLPGQDRYYEVSSISNCRDFQARRSKIRYKDQEGKTSFVHTLNGSGLATSRLMVALLENNQQEDGTILLPKALHKTLGEKLTP
jgi:seryl-tRNA synthetase